MSIESDKGHDIATMYYEIIHVVVSGKFCSKMCTGVHKLVLCRKMMFNAKESITCVSKNSNNAKCSLVSLHHLRADCCFTL